MTKVNFIYLLILGSATNLSRLSFENEKRIIYPKSKSKEFLHIKIGLSNRSINYVRKVLRYDDFLGNIVGYLSNIIILLYIFNVIYNSFGSRVYFANKFFIPPSDFQLKIKEDLQKKIDTLIHCKFEENKINHINHINHNNHNENNQIEDPNYENNRINFNHPVKPDSKIIQLDILDKSHTNSKTENHSQDKNKQYINLDEDKNNSSGENKINNFNNINFEAPIKKNLNSRNVENLNTQSIGNNLDYNFFEYVFYTFCSKKNKQKILKKYMLLESTQNFYDFYMDINTYIKKMMELEYLKYHLITSESHLNIIENFQPTFKDSYTENYGEAIFELYDTVEKSASISNVYAGIKKIDPSNSQLYNYLLKYY
jgi:hypothetical protein